MMIVAPHPDDETLACGGLISLARKQSKCISVVFVTDGGASHRGCCNLSPEILASIRRRLAVQACAILGVEESDMTWLGLSDGEIPDTQHSDFDRACNLMCESFEKINPEAVFAPCVMDGWPDHIATSNIVRAALAMYEKLVTLYWYPVWLFQKTELRFFPKIRQLKVINLDIDEVLNIKREAIKSYIRNVHPTCGNPYVGKLPPGFVESFENPYEFYFIARG